MTVFKALQKEMNILTSLGGNKWRSNANLVKNTKWKMKLHELGIMGQSVVYSALECESCGAVYPLQELGKNTSNEAIASMLKS